MLGNKSRATTLKSRLNKHSNRINHTETSNLENKNTIYIKILRVVDLNGLSSARLCVAVTHMLAQLTAADRSSAVPLSPHFRLISWPSYQLPNSGLLSHLLPSVVNTSFLSFCNDIYDLRRLKHDIVGVWWRGYVFFFVRNVVLKIVKYIKFFISITLGF